METRHESIRTAEEGQKLRLTPFKGGRKLQGKEVHNENEEEAGNDALLVKPFLKTVMTGFAPLTQVTTNTTNKLTCSGCSVVRGPGRDQNNAMLLELHRSKGSHDASMAS